MSTEQETPGSHLNDLTRRLQQARTAAATHYKELLITTFFPSNGADKDIEEEVEESKLIKPATPHQPGIMLYKDGTMEEVDNGIYQGLSEPRAVEGQDYIMKSETIFQSLLPHDPKPKSNNCI